MHHSCLIIHAFCSSNILLPKLHIKHTCTMYMVGMVDYYLTLQILRVHLSISMNSLLPHRFETCPSVTTIFVQ